MKVWDPLNGREILNLRGHTFASHSLAFRPEGDQLASAGGDQTIRLWNATRLKGDEGPESLNCEHEHEVWSVDYNPDWREIVSATWNGTLRLWNAADGTQSRTLTFGDVQSIFRAVFSPDGTRIAAATVSRDRMAAVKVWEAATGGDLLSFRDKGVFFSVAYDRTGRYLIREGPQHTVQVRDANTGQVLGVRWPARRTNLGDCFEPGWRSSRYRK